MQHFHKRTGPHPLWLHLNGGAAMMASLSDDNETKGASFDLLSNAMDGVRHYHDSKIQPFTRNMHELMHHNGTRLLAMDKNPDLLNAVIIVPSLINSWRIFDIEKDHSFIDMLRQSGLTPLIIDWADGVNNATIDDYICNHLYPLINQFKKPIKGIIGYCMGATFLPALLSRYPSLKSKIERFVSIAPPWDFSYQTPDQILRIQSLAIQTYAMGDDVPNDFVQSLFWAVDPLQVFKKFTKFPNVKNADRFVRVEDWLNEARPVSKMVIQTCLFDWYRDNKIVNGQWVIGDCQVDLNDMKDTDILIVKGAKDTLVPPQSIAPLERALPNAHAINIDTGHIGLMASDKAVDQAWKPIAEFINQ